ncbi:MULTISPECIES: hypothetical protein [Aerosakkonema]|uniref:hypothetical protein n=1 Tax=Aerosakkonema TaxID=1246629 RepID=UPI0035BA7750
MSELEKGSPAQENKAAAAAATLLLANYSFDLGGYPATELVERWSKNYPADWVRLAVIEALYQGRYKSISVEQILVIWLRRKQPIYHFKYEFERLVCNKLPKELREVFFSSASDAEEASQQELKPLAIQAPAISIPCDDLIPNMEAAPTSNPFEALVQPVSEEHTSKSNIALAQVKESHPNHSENSVELPSLLPKSDEEKTHLTNGNSDYQSSQQRENLEFTVYPEWGFSHRPIEQFIPEALSSDFYIKLKALAHPGQAHKEGKNGRVNF